MQIFVKALGATAISTLALAFAAQAQQAQQPRAQQETGQAQTADSQCIQRLNELGQRMNDDGYWLSGYSTYGTGGYGTGGFGSRTTTGGAVTGMPARTATPAGEPAGPAGTSPWANVTWSERPHYAIRTLIRAAHVLAQGGNEEGCMTVANAADRRYQGYVNQLAELGVEPQEITDWRQAEIATAVPVTETTFPRRVDDLVGADLRNAQDEDLGDINDVVLDPRTGDIQYVIVSRGGFFGLGSEEVAVPWDSLRVAASMNAFVLPVDQAAMEQAPNVAQENLIDPGQTSSIEQDEVESYWRDALKQ